MAPPIVASPRRSFAESFLQPAISGRGPTALPGLTLLLVVERDIPADPIVPQRWLETPDGERFLAVEAELALAHMKWAPRSEADALAAASLLALSLPGASVYGQGECPPALADAARQHHAAGPEARPAGEGSYEVTQYLCNLNAMPRPFPQQPPSLERQVVTVGPGVLRVRSEHLWPEREEPPRLAPAAPAGPPDDFDQVFDDPIIDWRRPTGIAGVELLSVFDHCQLAEDPLIPESWLEAGGKKFRPEKAQAALAHLGWAPASPEAALAAARLPLHGDRGGAGVVGVDPCAGLPKAVAAQHKAGPPQVTTLGEGRYQVVQFVYRHNHSPWPNMNLPVELERQTVTVAPGVLQVSTQRLWSGPPVHEPPSSNLPPG